MTGNAIISLLVTPIRALLTIIVFILRVTVVATRAFAVLALNSTGKIRSLCRFRRAIPIIGAFFW